MDTEQAHLARLDVVGDHGELLGRSLAHLSDEDAVYRLILDTIDSANYKGVDESDVFTDCAMGAYWEARK